MGASYLAVGLCSLLHADLHNIPAGIREFYGNMPKLLEGFLPTSTGRRQSSAMAKVARTATPSHRYKNWLSLARTNDILKRASGTTQRNHLGLSAASKVLRSCTGHTTRRVETQPVQKTGALHVWGTLPKWIASSLTFSVGQA